MYAMMRTRDYELILDEFVVEDKDGNEALMGDELTCSTKPRVRIKVSNSPPEARKVKVDVIRNGEVIRVFNGDTPLNIDFEDDDYKPGEKIYYRLDIRVGEWNHIIANPIFVRFK